MEKTRLEAFSDGVIAIIITLLVLEIKVPHVEGNVSSSSLLSALVSILPKLLSWALSFFMVLIMWVNHHRIFSDLKESDNGLLFLNGILLFFMAFVPFPTAFMGDYFTYPVSMFFFGICLAMVGISFYFLRLYLVKNPHLYKDNVDKEMQKKLLSKTVIGPVFYFIGGAVSFLSVYAAYLVFTAVPVYFVFFGTNRRK